MAIFEFARMERAEGMSENGLDATLAQHKGRYVRLFGKP